MDNIFQYAFMQRAFVVAAIIAVIAPCIGVSIVLKRLSAIGDATSHSALAGIAFGLLLGINPILGAVMFSIFAVIGIEVFRKSFGIIAKKLKSVIIIKYVVFRLFLYGTQVFIAEKLASQREPVGFSQLHV